MRQQLVMLEAPSEKFKINPKYYDAMPRPTKEERYALDLKMIERGQLEPIVVNPKMVILDGYSRFELLEARGKKIKYIIRKFKTTADELVYVVEVNVMRRQLNTFQRIEALYDLYKQRKKELKMYDYTSQLRTLKAIKEGVLTAPTLAEHLGYHRYYVNKILMNLIKDYCVGRESEFKAYGNGQSGGTTYYVYYVCPKGDERMAKEKIKIKGSASLLIGKIIGVNRNLIPKGATLIEKATPEVLESLRLGRTSIGIAYAILTHAKGSRPKKNVKGWYKNDLIECPLCNKSSRKVDFKVVRKSEQIGAY